VCNALAEDLRQVKRAEAPRRCDSFAIDEAPNDCALLEERARQENGVVVRHGEPVRSFLPRRPPSANSDCHGMDYRFVVG
jgi:hypothetical protein